jgi:hypothetical protein
MGDLLRVDPDGGKAVRYVVVRADDQAGHRCLLAEPAHRVRREVGVDSAVDQHPAAWMVYGEEVVRDLHGRPALWIPGVEQAGQGAFGAGGEHEELTGLRCHRDLPRG